MEIFCKLAGTLRRTLLIFLFVLPFSFNGFSQSETISELVKAGLHDVNLYFYPSTLRMLNIQKDPGGYDIVSGVNHLRLLTFSSDSLIGNVQSEMVKSLEKEGFEEVMTYRAAEVKVRLYGKYKGDEMKGLVGLIFQEEQNFVVDLDGKVDPMHIYKLSQDGINMPVLDSYFKNKDEEESRRKKYQEFRESMKEEEAKSAADSLSNQDTLKQ